MTALAMEEDAIQARRLMMRARIMEVQGRKMDARGEYSKLINRYPSAQRWATAAHQSLLTILLNDNPIDLVAIREQVRVLSPTNGYLSNALWNLFCRASVHEVQSATPERRALVWSQLVRELAQWNNTAALSNQTLNDLDALAVDLSETLVATIRDDLRNLVAAQPSPLASKDVQQLVSRRRKQGDSERDILFRLLVKASSFKSATDTTEAIHLYRRIIDRTQNQAQQAVCVLARRKLLSLLVVNDPIDHDEIQEQLQALTPEDGRFSNDLWNHIFVGHMRRVAAAKPDERSSLWTEALADLTRLGDSFPITVQAIIYLDKLITLLGDNSSLPALQVVTDLLLLVPDIGSMHHLQSRRVTLLSQQEAWPDAISAASLNVVFALATDGGPYSAAQRCLEMADSAGWSIAKQQRLGRRLLGERKPTHEAGTQPQGPLPFQDQSLKKAARRALGGSLTTRCRAYLNLFAANTTDAVRDIVGALYQIPIGFDPIDNALMDISIVLAVADGHFLRCHRLTQWIEINGQRADLESTPDRRHDSLLETPISDLVNEHPTPSQATDAERPILFRHTADNRKARFARQTLRHMEERFIAWGIDALRAGDLRWAAALDTSTNADRSRTMIDTFQIRGPPRVNRQDCRRHLLNHVALRARTIR